MLNGDYFPVTQVSIYFINLIENSSYKCSTKGPLQLFQFEMLTY